MNPDLLYQVALTLIKNIGPVHTKILMDHYKNASSIFSAKHADLEKLEGIGTVRASAIKHFKDFTRAEEEIAFIEKFQISPLFITDENYPKRLLNCYDPPVLLYYKGSADVAGTIAGLVTGANVKQGDTIKIFDVPFSQFIKLENDFRHYMDMFNKTGQLCKNTGLYFAYHNENYEFNHSLDGTVLYDLLLQSSDKNLVWQQIDTGNMYEPGGRAMDYLKKYPGRFFSMHVRDEIKKYSRQFVTDNL